MTDPLRIRIEQIVAEAGLSRRVVFICPHQAALRNFVVDRMLAIVGDDAAIPANHLAACERYGLLVDLVADQFREARGRSWRAYLSGHWSLACLRFAGVAYRFRVVGVVDVRRHHARMVA